MTIKNHGGVFGRNPTFNDVTANDVSFNDVTANDGAFATLSSDDGEVYAPGNIVGAVSESSGTPTGAIIEKGNNANGNYVKYADGTMICWTPASLGYTLSGLTATDNDDWTFPATFSGSGVYSGRADADGVRAHGLTPWAGSKGNTAQLRFRTQADCSAAALHLYAIGTWY